MKRIFLLLLTLFLVSTPVLADSEQYLVLGNDLTPEEEETVLNLLGVDNINNYNVSYITNAEEHQALGNYLPAEVIGSRALSSVLLTSNKKGINVNTKNINYVTEEMYQNALITAGLKNVTMDVAGPYPISGTAALVAATKAYEIMTGEIIDQESLDVANEELTVTQDIADEVGQEDATDLMAALKQQVVEEDLNEEQINTALNDLESKMNISLSDKTKNQIINVMLRIENLNIDSNALKEQATNIYNNITDYINNNPGFFENIINAIRDFFNNIFNSFSGNSNIEA